MKAHSQETQATITPEKALQFLKEGNKRFVSNLKQNQNLLEQVNRTKSGQYPFVTILSCIDSRVPVEFVFDQGLGDVFSVRVAGNVVGKDVLGSIEFGAELAGALLVVILGHTGCGAVKGACDGVELGNLTHLLHKIKPAVDSVKEPQQAADRTSENADFVNKVSEKNVQQTLHQLRDKSDILAKLEQAGKIKIVGAMYDIETGKVDFYAD